MEREDQRTTTESGLAPLYDAARALFSREGRWRAALADQIAPEPHDVILDLGCGGGALTVMLARTQPAAEVIGLDDRPALVAQARARATEAGVAASFLEADPADLAAHVGSRTPTKIVLTLTDLKSAGERLSRLQAARQVIDPAGVLHVVDFGAQRGAVMPWLSALLRGPDAADGETAPLIRAAGFVAVEETATWRTPAGAVSLYRARAS